MAARPPRLITCMQGPPLLSPSLPTHVIFPFWIVTDDTIELFASKSVNLSVDQP